MTWFETHERTRIIREVEAAAAVDTSGQLPWNDAWAPFFADRAGLLTTLRARWDRMCIAQLEELTTPQQVRDTAARLRRSNAGILRILEHHGLTGFPAACRPPPSSHLRSTRRPSLRAWGQPGQPASPRAASGPPQLPAAAPGCHPTPTNRRHRRSPT